MNEAPLILEGIEKGYRKKDVLRGVDLRLEPGATVGLLGKNGAGKSTLIKTALGLLRPQAGEARVFGERAWNMSDGVKARIGYVAQTTVGFAWMRVRELLDYTGAFYPGWDAALTARLVNEWELDPDDRCGKLSEGQRQKLAIIRAMGHSPDLLVLDEPVASLDPIARRQFLKHLIERNAAEGNTILFSTHITSDLERVAGQAALLKDGRIALHCELDELKERVCRLHIQAESPLPDPLPIPNRLRARVNGHNAAVTVRDFSEPQRQALASQLKAVISVEPLNLEDIFLELH